MCAHIKKEGMENVRSTGDWEVCLVSSTHQFQNGTRTSSGRSRYLAGSQSKMLLLFSSPRKGVRSLLWTGLVSVNVPGKVIKGSPCLRRSVSTVDCCWNSITSTHRNDSGIQYHKNVKRWRAPEKGVMILRLPRLCPCLTVAAFPLHYYYLFR